MTADAILQGLLEANLAASAAVTLILALRRPVRARCGARAAYGLWLLAPVAAAGSLLPARVAPAPPPAPLGEPALDLAGVVLGAPTTAPPIDASSVLLAVWLVGAAVLAAVAIHRSRRLASDPDLGPALVGVIRPRLVLPADFETRFDADERRLILAHEAAHAAAGHPAINGLVEAARCLNWFNPLVHAAAFYARIDQELACDAAVVARYPRERRTYAEALLKSQLSPAFLPFGCQWPGRSKPLLTERIEMLARPRASRARHLAAAAAIALAAGSGAYAAWAAQPARAPAAYTAVRAAIEAGDGLAVRAGGGAPLDVIAALKVEVRAKRPGGAAYAAQTLAELDRFADTSAGASLAFVPFTGPDFKTPAGKSVGGAHWGIERRTPNGMVQYVMLMKDGKLFMGAPHPAPPATGAASEAAAVASERDPASAAARPGTAAVIARQDPPAARDAPGAAIAHLMPDWIAKPDAVDVVKFYPPAAAAAKQEGRATIGCRVDGQGRLGACQTIDEAPEDAGFGDAALALAAVFQMKPLDRNGVATAGQYVRIPFKFALPTATVPPAAAPR